MGDKHYQLYISSAHNDVQAERLKLHYTLLQMDVFFYELIDPRSTSNTTQARKLIDSCDYAVFLLGNDCGRLSASGISYLNLDFLYALNRKKTIISFVDALPKSNQAAEKDDMLMRHTATLREQIKKDSQYRYEYRSLLDLERGIKTLCQEAFQKSPTTGWVNKDNVGDSPRIIQLQQRIEDLEQQLEQCDLADGMARSGSSSKDTIEVDSQSENIVLNYRTQAYQDGNLQDLHFSREFSWQQLFNVLAVHFEQPAEERVFQKVLNRYLESVAFIQARQQFPRVHAVSRTKIDPTSLQKVMLQMRQKDWIVPQSIAHERRNLWQLGAAGQVLTGQK